jgi:hypothetical protein
VRAAAENLFKEHIDQRRSVKFGLAHHKYHGNVRGLGDWQRDPPGQRDPPADLAGIWPSSDKIACMRLTDGSTAALPTWYWYGPGAPPADKGAIDPAVLETLNDLRRQWSGSR